MITFKLSEKPPTNNSMYFNVRGKGRVKTSRYSAWLMNSLAEMATIKLPKNTNYVGKKYGLIIALKKRANADYSNYIKPIEDLLVRYGITPDDKHNLLPLCIGQEEEGVTVTILNEEEAQGFVGVVKNFVKND